MTPDFTHFSRIPSEHLQHYRQFWWRSFVQATAAEVLASQFGSPAFCGECYTTSILCGLGKLAMLKSEPEKYLDCLRNARTRKSPLVSLEQEMFGFNHSQLSSYLLQQMGLPERCHLAIGAIADPGLSSLPPNMSLHPLLEVTRIADAVASLICDENPAIAFLQLEDALASVSLPGQPSAEAVINLVHDHLKAAAPLFEIDPPNLPSASDLLQEALDELSQMAVMAEIPDPNQAVRIELLRENHRLERRVADLLHVSRIDSLTRLCNREFLMQEMREQAARHRARGLSFGLAVVDIDHFKKVNDTYGHQAGVAALKAVAETLQNTIRATDLAGRYGGEEFVVLLADSNAAGLAVAGERLRAKIEETVIEFEGLQIQVTVSIGLAEGQVAGTDEEFCEQLFAAADAAMYQAKNSGRNCFVVHSLLSNANVPRSIERIRSDPASIIA